MVVLRQVVELEEVLVLGKERKLKRGRGKREME